METVTQTLALLATYGMPVLPYLIISLVVHQSMNRFIKPMVRAHRTEKGYYDSPAWLWARRGMGFYPMVLGLAIALPAGLNVLYGVGAGAAAQAVFLVLRSLAKKKLGVDIEVEDLSKSMICEPDSIIPSPPPIPQEFKDE